MNDMLQEGTRHFTRRRDTEGEETLVLEAIPRWTINIIGGQQLELRYILAPNAGEKFQRGAIRQPGTLFSSLMENESEKYPIPVQTRWTPNSGGRNSLKDPTSVSAEPCSHCLGSWAYCKFIDVKSVALCGWYLWAL
jgi:hypothetical protein